jgi:hypothetical protein
MGMTDLWLMQSIAIRLLGMLRVAVKELSGLLPVSRDDGMP